MFKALLISNDPAYQCQYQHIDDDQLPEGDVLIDVIASTINYKDGLAITGRSPVARKFPLVPGIDLAGRVAKSASSKFVVGAQVVLNGFGVGETHWGGLAQKARLSSEWLLQLPSALSPHQAMAIGTAGYTAMLCVMRLEALGITPGRGPILVTGAAGGVGGIAIALLDGLGYEVIASTGRAEETDYLKHLGASEVIDRKSLSSAGKAMNKERWAGAVDTVGSYTLANVCAGTQYRGVVTACGLAQGIDFPASVAPFILRGLTLAGIDSVYAPMAERELAWRRLAKELDFIKLASMSREYGLSEAIELGEAVLQGKVRGRVVIDVNR